MGQEKRERHVLEILYIVIIAAMLAGSCIYTVFNHPVRELLDVRIAQEKREIARLDVERKKNRILPKPPSPFSRLINRVKLAWPFVWPDILMASVVYSMWILCSYVFLRRFITWLKLEQSGDMAALRGSGLEAKALEANMDRKKPIE